MYVVGSRVKSKSACKCSKQLCNLCANDNAWGKYGELDGEPTPTDGFNDNHNNHKGGYTIYKKAEKMKDNIIKPYLVATRGI